MENREYKKIFEELYKKNENETEYHYENTVKNFVELHQKMLEEMKKSVKSIDPIVTLRNLKYCCYLNKSNISPRIEAEISYTARFPKTEREDFEIILKKFGKLEMEKEKINKIEEELKKNYLYYNEAYKKAAYLVLTACLEGLHPLLIGKNGSGLTTFAKFIASLYNQYNKKILLLKI